MHCSKKNKENSRKNKHEEEIPKESLIQGENDWNPYPTLTNHGIFKNENKVKVGSSGLC